MNNKLMLVNISIIIGIVLATNIDISIWSILIIIIINVSGILIIDRANAKKVIICILCISIAICHTNIHKERYLSQIKTEQGEFYFKVIEEKTNSYILKEQSRQNEIQRGFWVLYKKENINVIIGDYIKINGAKKDINIYKNFNTFDKEKYLASRKILGEIKPKTVEKIKNRMHYSDYIWLKTDKYLKEKKIDSDAIIQGLVFGNVDSSDNLVKLFREIGIGHVIAISGLHLSIIVLVLDFLLKKLKIFKSYRYILILGILAWYIIAIGGPTSAIRAYIMLGIYFASKILLRRHDFISTIALASIIILCISPYYLYDAGYQLSFIAVLFVGYVNPQILKNYYKKTNRILIACINIALIQIELAPIMIYHFNYLPLLSILFNIMLIPLAGIMVLASFVMVIMVMLYEPLAIIPLAIVEGIAEIYSRIAELLSKHMVCGLNIGIESFIWVILIYLIAFIILNYKYYFVKNNYIANTSAAMLSLIIISIIFFEINRYNFLCIKHIDVGQGDGCIFKYHGKTYMIDSGGNEMSNLGEYMLLPYLLKNKSTSLDAVFLSHFDSDHCKGLIEIMPKLDIKSIYMPTRNICSENQKKIIELAEEKNIPIIELSNGDRINLAKRLRIEVLHPDKDAGNDENNDSLVFILSYDSFKEIFVGDIESEGEAKLDNIGKVSVAKIAHHGSKTSTTDEYLDKIKFETAIISVGKNNRYGHPSKEVLERLNLNSTFLYRTDEDGEIILISDGKSYIINKYIDIAYWDNIYNIYIFGIIVIAVYTVKFKEVENCTIQNILNK